MLLGSLVLLLSVVGVDFCCFSGGGGGGDGVVAVIAVVVLVLGSVVIALGCTERRRTYARSLPRSIFLVQYCQH